MVVIRAIIITWRVSSNAGQPWIQKGSMFSSKRLSHLFYLLQLLLTRCKTLADNLQRDVSHGAIPRLPLVIKFSDEALEWRERTRFVLNFHLRMEIHSDSVRRFGTILALGSARQEEANRSATTLPGMLTCPGIHTKNTFVPALCTDKSRMDWTTDASWAPKLHIAVIGLPTSLKRY